MFIDIDDYLAHYGVARRSGRYPWGSGGNESGERTGKNRTFLDEVAYLKGKGLSEVEIAQGMGMSTTEFRAKRSVAKNEQKSAQISQALALKEKQYSNVAAAAKMGIPESTYRTLIDPATKEKIEVQNAVANMLR